MLPPLENPHFELNLAVRDYELDCFGVVNNAVYQNYLEHTRHAFLEAYEVSMDKLRENEFSPIITRAELEYRDSLRSGDKFVVRVGLEKLTKVKFVFLQDIRKQADMTLVLSAKITGTILNSQGRPSFPEAFLALRALMKNSQ